MGMVQRLIALLVLAVSTEASNECRPAKACNVCEACCKSYIRDDSACDECVVQECPESSDVATSWLVVPSVLLFCSLFGICYVWTWEYCPAFSGLCCCITTLPFSVKVMATVFVIYVNFGFAVLWYFGWIQPLMQKLAVYMFF